MDKVNLILVVVDEVNLLVRSVAEGGSPPGPVDKLDLVVRSVEEVDLVHDGHKEEVDLFVVAVDGVKVVHRSDGERSTSSS